ncbi:MAG TPA: hypothetical protein VGC93_06260 [Thermoanaerobaculia bacterium]
MTPAARALAAVALVAAASLPLYRGGAELALLAPVARGFAAATAGVLALAGVEATRDGVVLRHASGFAIEVTTACTAWPHAALWLAAVAGLAPGWRRGARAAAAGLAILAAANISRLAAVFAVGARWPAAFDVAHGVAGELLLAATLVVLWRLAPRGELVAASSSTLSPGTA